MNKNFRQRNFELKPETDFPSMSVLCSDEKTMTSPVIETAKKSHNYPTTVKETPHEEGSS